MSNEHTKGRLTLFTQRDVIEIQDADGDARRPIVHWMGFDPSNRSLSERKANARRLVACWNACDVMADPEEEIAQVMENVRVARKERDELIAALRACVDIAKSWHGVVAWDIYYDHSPEMKPIRESLVKHAPKP